MQTHNFLVLISYKTKPNTKCDLSNGNLLGATCFRQDLAKSWIEETYYQVFINCAVAMSDELNYNSICKACGLVCWTVEGRGEIRPLMIVMK